MLVELRCYDQEAKLAKRHTKIVLARWNNSRHLERLEHTFAHIVFLPLSMLVRDNGRHHLVDNSAALQAIDSAWSKLCNAVRESD